MIMCSLFNGEMRKDTQEFKESKSGDRNSSMLTWSLPIVYKILSHA